MAFTFRLTFNGLCAFVPNRPFVPENEGDSRSPFVPASEAVVLLPNVLEPRISRLSKDSSEWHALGAHIPTLSFDIDHLMAESDEIENLSYSLPGETRQGLFVLQEADLEIWPEGRKPAADSLAYTVPEPADNAPQDNENSLRWILKGAQFLPDDGRVDPTLIKRSIASPDEGRKLTERVVARVFLTEGNLSARVREPGGDFVRWGLKRDNGSLLEEFIAHQAVLEIEAERQVDLVMRHHSSSDVAIISLAPPDPLSVDAIVEVSLGNLELDTSLGLDIQHSVNPDRLVPSTVMDTDFAAYYELTARRQGNSVPTINEDVLSGVEGPTCRLIELKAELLPSRR